MPPEFFLDRSLGRGVAEGLVEHEAALFYLDNQQLRRDEMVDRFHGARDAIHQAVERGKPATYAVTVTGIRRTWP